MSHLLLGNEAIARGAYEAGVRVATAYPGTPSTEITEYIAKYNEVYAEWSPNEKVALEAAVGASIGGARAMCSMKHVGLNVAADPLFTAAYTGVNGGLVICVADDPGMHSSQNEQDSRRYAAAAKLPMLEPSDSAECLSYMKLAFEMSEQCDTPVLVRLTTRIAHARSVAEISERIDVPLKPYTKDAGKYVMMPAMARKRRGIIEERDKLVLEFADGNKKTREENSDNITSDNITSDNATNDNITSINTSTNQTTGFPLNHIEWNDRKIGVIAAGISYQQAKQALGDRASYLKLGMVNPLPSDLISEFVRGVEICYVIEELDPVIETRCAAMGHYVCGKDMFPRRGDKTSIEDADSNVGINSAMPNAKPSTFPPYGEIDANTIRKIIFNEDTNEFTLPEAIPARPPVLCAGCPHRAVFHVMKQMKLIVMGDIGCYTLGALPPLTSIDACVCMGASIGMAHGFEKAAGRENSKKTVAVIGDSTFLHSGITGLMDVVYNKGASTTVILDNSITGMTGHQEHPATGKTIKGEPTYAVNLEKLCEAVGVKRVAVVDALDMKAVKQALTDELAADEPSIIIARRPCRLILKEQRKPLAINEDLCRKCGACLRIGCPALAQIDGVYTIDANQCNGCGACSQVCPHGVPGISNYSEANI
jgi:indolepyruvate ferredoxin oxidoreductase alpha subunit